METNTKKGIDGFTLKMIAIVTMLIDHTAAVLLERFLANNPETDPFYNTASILDIVMRCIGRIAFPIFIFCMVQGFTHTRNKLKYAIRLGLFAFISEIPFNLAIANSLTSFRYQNVFFTLFLGFLFMWFTDFICKKEIKPWLGYLGVIIGSLTMGSYIAAVIIGSAQNIGGASLSDGALITIFFGSFLLVTVLEIVFCLKKSFQTLSHAGLSVAVLGLLMWAGDLLNTDYGAFGVLAIATAYFFRENKMKSFGLMLIPLTLASFIEAIALLDLIFIKNYNGEKGKSMKYFFYAFYPVHLLIIALIAMAIGL